MGDMDRNESREQVSESLTERDTLPPATTDTSPPESSRQDIGPAGEIRRPAPAAAVSDSVPEMFGRYRLIKLLGEGAMGSVYLAEDTQLRRQVALKVPKFSADASPLLLERFYREAQAAAALRHANICPVFDVGEINGQHYISMAYIEGRPLKDFVDPDNPAPVDQAASVVCRLADALQQAHSQGVIHRDLKPANIIVDENREPIVMDFGLARQMENEDVRLTSTGAILGSPAYMSPEQANSQHDLMGPVSDIYSLGIILYELLTGDLPFRGPLASVLVQILTQEPQKPSELREGLDPRLESICLKMIAKKIEDRYQSMSAVSEALTGWLTPDSQTSQPAMRVDLAAFDAAKAVRDVRVEKLEGHKQRAQSLRKRGSYETALKILKKMAGLQDTRYAEYAEWARREFSEVRGESRKIREGLPTTCATARQLMARHDYRQAADLLRQIPKPLRNDEVNRLLAQAIEFEEEASDLIAEIEVGLRRPGNQETLLPKLQRLLELKPGSRKAKQWQRQLSRARWLGVVETHTDHKGHRYFDVAGRTIHPWMFGAIVAVALTAFGLTTWAVIYTLNEKATTAKTPTENASVAKAPTAKTPNEKAPIATTPTENAPAAKTPTAKTLTAKIPAAKTPAAKTPTKNAPAAAAVKTHMTPAQLALGDPIVNRVGMLLVPIPAGEFLMGSLDSDRALPRDEKPRHLVKITKPFYLSGYEVTQQQYEKVTGTRPWQRRPLQENGPDYAATHVNWNDAVEFCRKLSEQESVEYRLPTEAEWEYACRAGTTTAYSFGNDASKLGQYAWYFKNASDIGEDYAHRVGQKRPNPWGLYDMHGNVQEWCQDSYARYGSDPLGPAQGTERVLRGGTFVFFAVSTRSADRQACGLVKALQMNGFRVARTYP